MTKLSIITINRNNAEGLRKTIESVVSQTFTNFEYLIIDGASTDNSVEVIKEYADKITYWVSEPDTGIYNAMNKGIKMAQGEYLQFLNSGDWLSSNTILEEVFHTVYNKADIIYGDTNFIINENTINVFRSCQNSNNILTLADFLNTSINHQSCFIKKITFQKYGLYDENWIIASDWLFFIKIVIFESSSVFYINKIIANYQTNGISANQEICMLEKTKILQTLLPLGIIKDYENMISQNKLFHEYERDVLRYKHRFQLIDKVITFVKRLLIPVSKYITQNKE